MSTHVSSNDEVFFVDDEDDWLVTRWKWNVDKYGYIRRRDGVTNKTIMLHNIIMPPPEGMTVDHINRDTLNNCKSNLRFATRRQQTYNRGHRGVTLNSGKWVARIQVEGKRLTIGSFVTREEAEEAYKVEFDKRNNF